MSGHPVDFVDLPALLRTLAALPVFSGTPNSVRRGIKLDVGRSSKVMMVRGVAYTHARRLRIVVGQWVTAANVAEVLLHELVHLAMFDSEGHGERYRRTLARAALQAWGIEVDPNPPPAVARNGHRLSAYVLDDHIHDALMPLIESGAVALPEPKKKPVRSRAEIAATLVEKRAKHVVKMHEKAQHRLKLAKAAEQRWRTKVRYYERQAAKRGAS